MAEESIPDNQPPRDQSVIDLRGGAVFQTTAWTDILTAGNGDSPDAGAALERLCRLYWPPLYSYLRRHGHAPETASDLTQQFFLGFLRRESIKKASQARGRFRTFLLTSLQHFLVDEWKAASALKRGGGLAFISFDALDETSRRAIEPAMTDTPARAFERGWAAVVLEEAARRHREEHNRADQLALYQQLSRLHSEVDEAPGYTALAAEMGVPIGTLKSLVSRFRKRYRALIREVIGETVTGPEELEDELRHLLQIFSG